MKKEEKVEKLKDLLEGEAKRSKKEAIELAEAEELRRNQGFTVLSIIGPIALSFLFICIDLDINNLVCWKLFVDIVATVTLIIAVLILHARVDVARYAVNKIKLSKAYRNKQIDIVEKKNNRLEERQSFFCSVIETIGRTINVNRNIVAFCYFRQIIINRCNKYCCQIFYPFLSFFAVRKKRRCNWLRKTFLNTSICGRRNLKDLCNPWSIKKKAFIA